MSWRTIKEVNVGDVVNHHKYGLGIVHKKTQRTITITFENGVTSKNTYKYSDAYFYVFDF